MDWNKIKSLFVETDAGAARTPALGTDADFEKELASYEVPPGPGATLPAGAQTVHLSGTLDFQGLYDSAGIPDTDEVESLEKFLSGLDGQLPLTSKVAAAKAFLGAISKSPDHVLADAGRKIQVVRAVASAKSDEVAGITASQEKAIAELERQIETHRKTIESSKKELESIKQQCAAEEGRLQAARVFFGHLGNAQT